MQFIAIAVAIAIAAWSGITSNTIHAAAVAFSDGRYLYSVKMNIQIIIQSRQSSHAENIQNRAEAKDRKRW